MNETRYDTLEVARQREQIAQHPAYRQEMVAHHYASLAQLAVEMGYLVKRRRFYSQGPDAETTMDGLIAHYEADIAKAHREAFGEWPTWWLAREGVES